MTQQGKSTQRVIDGVFHIIVVNGNTKVRREIQGILAIVLNPEKSRLILPISKLSSLYY